MHIMYPRCVATLLDLLRWPMRPHPHSASCLPCCRLSCCLAAALRDQEVNSSRILHGFTGDWAAALRVVPASMQAKVVGAKYALRELHSTNTWQTLPQHIWAACKLACTRTHGQLQAQGSHLRAAACTGHASFKHLKEVICR
jgi:hypothetical protein